MSEEGGVLARILLVEDEKHLATGIRFNLEAEGYQVTVAGDGPTALRRIGEDPESYGLVILDLMLPGMSGYAVCEALRDAGNEVPVLILSARTLTEDRTRGFEVGADQYLMKPFDLDELLSRVRRLLDRSRRPPGAGPRQGTPVHDIAFSNVEVDFETFEASVGGRSLRLTALEVKLLRYFVENEGRVVSRDELLEQVWGFNNPPATRTVDNFVSRLRRYFEPDPGSPRHFLSIRGAGYRFLSGAEDE